MDPSWGFADTKNWTLFAGIENISGSDGSGTAAYLEEPQPVKRGLAGIEFTNAAQRLEFKVNLDAEYKNLTGKDSADDFIAGGRRIIVSAWVENTVGGIRVRIGDAD